MRGAAANRATQWLPHPNPLPTNGRGSQTLPRPPPTSYRFYPSMPLRTKIECPECDADLVVKRGGVCPNCGARINEHVARVRAREKRIEQIVAVVATVLVVGVAVVTSGATLLEGIAAYAIVGGAMYYLARRTFV